MSHYSRKQRQLKYLVKRTNRLLASNNGLIDDRIERLRLRIQHLLDDLKSVIHHIQLRKTVGALLLVLGLSITNIRGQVFAEPVNNPFGAFYTSAEDIGEVMDLGFDFVDLDGDGDLDILSLQYTEYYSYDTGPVSIKYQQNVGTNTDADFSPPLTNQFDLSLQALEGCDFSITIAIDIDAVDLDGDGDYDVVLSAIYSECYSDTTESQYFQNLYLWIENIGTGTSPEFSPLTAPSINPFGLQPPTVSNPSWEGVLLGTDFVDIDNDGDYDVLSKYNFYDGESGSYTNEFIFHRNSGTDLNPNFDAPEYNPFNIQPLDNAYGYSSSLHFVDIDQDGDLDFFTSFYQTSIIYYENIGDVSTPNYLAPNPAPFNLDFSGGWNFFDFCDIDNDGDVDYFSHGIYNDDYQTYNCEYQENISGTTSIPALLDDISLYPNPVSNNLTVDLGDLSGVNTSIKLYDAFSRLVYEGQSTSTTQIDVSTFAKGIYTVEISNTDKVLRSKVVVE